MGTINVPANEQVKSAEIKIEQFITAVAQSQPVLPSMKLHLQVVDKKLFEYYFHPEIPAEIQALITDINKLVILDPENPDFISKSTQLTGEMFLKANKLPALFPLEFNTQQENNHGENISSLNNKRTSQNNDRLKEKNEKVLEIINQLDELFTKIFKSLKPKDTSDISDNLKDFLHQISAIKFLFERNDNLDLAETHVVINLFRNWQLFIKNQNVRKELERNHKQDFTELKNTFFELARIRRESWTKDMSTIKKQEKMKLPSSPAEIPAFFKGLIGKSASAPDLRNGYLSADDTKPANNMSYSRRLSTSL